MRLVLTISFTVFDSKRISINVENLEILEPCLFLRLSSEVYNHLFKGSYFVVSYRENVELSAVMKPINA